MAVYEMGPVATAMEHNVLRWMAGQLGLPEGAGGVLTSGGSAGNLTALLAARQAKAGYDAWNGGAARGPAAHGARAPRRRTTASPAPRSIMGWGAGGVTPVPVDARFRLRPDALEDALAAATARRTQGHRRGGQRRLHRHRRLRCRWTRSPTSAERHGLWFHVDGAHGASAALEPASTATR